MFKWLLSLILSLAVASCANAQMGANLVPISSATHTAVKSGSWQDQTVWDNGIPTVGAKVVIPADFTVTNHAETEDVSWIRILGKLTCCDHCDVKFNVHTIYVDMSGSLVIGMPGMPATGNVVVDFIDGPFLEGDKTKLSRGLICHGKCTVCGVEKTGFDIVDGEVAVNATTLTLKNVPYNWKIGDKIILAGTDGILGENQTDHKYQSQILTITGINGRNITFAEPVKYRHFKWREDLVYHCANITRNIVFKSRKTDTIDNRAHLMFMSAANDLRYYYNEGMGRTDASKTVTDPRFDAYGEFIVGSDENVRARYADHIHRAGPFSSPSIRIGCVARALPGSKAKWGFLNHASNVHYYNCIALEFFGAGFATEEGQERGKWDRCLSCLNRGFGDSITSNDADHGRFYPAADFNKDGAGFWSHAPLMEVNNCVAFDNSGRGFGLFLFPMNGYPDFGSGNPIPDYLRFPIQHDKSLLETEYTQTEWWLYQKPTVIPAGFIALKTFDGNIAYNNKVGFQMWWMTSRINISSRLALPINIRSKITNLTIWGRGAMCHMEYTRQTDVEGLKVIGDGIFRSEHKSITKWQPALLIRMPHIKVTKFDSSGKTRRVEEVGTAEGYAPTHYVEP